jgi:hypothetical protein
LTRVIRAVALSVVTTVSLSGCGAAHSVLGIHAAPTAGAASPPLTDARADSILARIFAAASQADAATGAAARAAQRSAYTGEGLRALGARIKLAGIQSAGGEVALLGAPRPRLLAVSRGDGYPRLIIAQTVTSEGGLPFLHLLTTPDPLTPYRIGMSVTMLPLSTVQPFDALSLGSPLVTAGTRLAVTPSELLNRYAAGMAFPGKAPSNPLIAADSFSTQLRTRAAGVANEVSAQAAFSQVHKVVPGSVYAVQQASGDALVFGALQRTDSFAVKPGQAINTVADKGFVLMSGKKRVTKVASRTTLEFVVFTVPRSKGQATLVAASEQLIAGSGS